MKRFQFQFVWGVYHLRYHELFGWAVKRNGQFVEYEEAADVVSLLGYSYF